MPDPYETLAAHIISVSALYCEDGCGRIEPAVGFVFDDKDAALELAKRGWAVRPHSMGGHGSLCPDCTARYDEEHS